MAIRASSTSRLRFPMDAYSIAWRATSTTWPATVSMIHPNHMPLMVPSALGGT
jgi:hypothetical protein